MCSLIPRLSPLRSRESLGTSLHYVYKHSIKTNAGRNEEILKWGFQSYLCMHSLRQNLYFCSFAVFTKLSCCYSASAVLSSNLYIAIHALKNGDTTYTISLVSTLPRSGTQILKLCRCGEILIVDKHTQRLRTG